MSQNEYAIRLRGVVQKWAGLRKTHASFTMSFFSSPEVMVSIIGTAGRREDGSKLTPEIFYRAIDKTKEIIKDQFKLSLEQVHLVSGGAAWMGMYMIL